MHRTISDSTESIKYNRKSLLRVSRVLRPIRHITSHFRDESFQAITCTGTDNTKRTTENTPKTQKLTQKKQTRLR